MKIIQLTPKQHAALELYQSNGHTLEQFVVHGKNGFHGDYEPLKAFRIDVMARLLYQPDSYVVEESYAVGDRVKYPSDSGYVYGIYERRNENVIYAYWGGSDRTTYVSAKIVERMTPEDIKDEQEHKVWKSIGRKVGEIKPGDIGFDPLGRHYQCMHEIQALHKDGDLFRLYPAGSFIEFGGASYEDS